MGPIVSNFSGRAVEASSFELSINPRLSWKTVQHAKQCLSQFLVHCEDHAPHHLMVYCPRAYFQAAWRTWNDPDVFTKLEEEPADTKARLLSSIPKSLSKRYPWAFDMKGGPLHMDTSCQSARKPSELGARLLTTVDLGFVICYKQTSCASKLWFPLVGAQGTA